MQQNKKIRAGIIGAAGYTGGELIRLLLRHPYVDIVFAHSSSNAGNPISLVHRDLEGDTDMLFSGSHNMEDTDVLFLCGAHGSSVQFIQANPLPDQLKVIDLSNDFRLRPNAIQGNRSFVYGLPEINRQEIAAADSIANPGCFATAIQLALLPLAAAGLLGDAYVTAVTGSTGAGQSLSTTSHFSWRSGNISAYKTLQHQHVPEIRQSLAELQPDYNAGLHFVPWRGDFPRGIYASAVVDCSLTGAQLKQLYREFYNDAVFVKVSDTMIDMKQVLNTNKCLLGTEVQDGKAVIHSAIDNLLKGACGQAIQNMNLMYGLEESTSLQLKGIAF